MINFYPILLWFQLSYSIWQFVRSAKYFRIPYILLSALIQGRLKDSYPKDRSVIKFFEKDNTRSKWPEYEKNDYKKTTNVHTLVNDNFDEFHYYLNLDHNLFFEGSLDQVEMVDHLIRLKESKVVIADEQTDLMAPNFYLLKDCTIDKIISEINKGRSLETISCKTIIDFSSEEILNKDFLRLMSIMPLMLQAKNYNFLSSLLSVLIIFIDIFSFYSNRLWKFIKNNIIDSVKKFLSSFKSPETREFLHHFFSTISPGFLYCDYIKKKFYRQKYRKIMLIGGLNKLPKGVDKIEFSSFSPRSDMNLEPVGERTLVYNGDSLRFNYTSEAIDGELEYNLKVSLGLGPEIYSGFFLMEDLSRVISCFEIFESEGCIIAEKMNKNRIHLPSIDYLFDLCMTGFLVLDLLESKEFIISDHFLEQSQKNLVNSLEIDPEITFRLIRHNKEFFKKPMYEFIVTLLKLNTSASKPQGVGNSQWKRYASDVSLILMESGKYGKIRNTTIKPPSKTLLKLKETQKDYNNTKIEFTTNRVFESIKTQVLNNRNGIDRTFQIKKGPFDHECRRIIDYIKEKNPSFIEKCKNTAALSFKVGGVKDKNKQQNVNATKIFKALKLNNVSSGEEKKTLFKSAEYDEIFPLCELTKMETKNLENMKRKGWNETGKIEIIGKETDTIVLENLEAYKCALLKKIGDLNLEEREAKERNFEKNEKAKIEKSRIEKIKEESKKKLEELGLFKLKSETEMERLVKERENTLTKILEELPSQEREFPDAEGWTKVKRSKFSKFLNRNKVFYDFSLLKEEFISKEIKTLKSFKKNCSVYKKLRGFNEELSQSDINLLEQRHIRDGIIKAFETKGFFALRSKIMSPQEENIRLWNSFEPIGEVKDIDELISKGKRENEELKAMEENLKEELEKISSIHSKLVEGVSGVSDPKDSKKHKKLDKNDKNIKKVKNILSKLRKTDPPNGESQDVSNIRGKAKKKSGKGCSNKNMKSGNKMVRSLLNSINGLDSELSKSIKNEVIENKSDVNKNVVVAQTEIQKKRAAILENYKPEIEFLKEAWPNFSRNRANPTLSNKNKDIAHIINIVEGYYDNKEECNNREENKARNCGEILKKEMSEIKTLIKSTLSDYESRGKKEIKSFIKEKYINEKLTPIEKFKASVPNLKVSTKTYRKFLGKGGNAFNLRLTDSRLVMWEKMQKSLDYIRNNKAELIEILEKYLEALCNRI